ncbi:MAG: homocitrate synthase [Hydrogenobacter sp.]
MRIFITDTTLREGMQSANIELSYKQRRELFFLLAQAGIHEIEVGVPAHSEEERSYIKELVNSKFGDKVIAWNRANIKDLEKSLECGAKRVEIAFPSSDIMIEKKFGKTRDYVLGLAEEIIPFIKSKGLYISVGLEDVSRADTGFVLRFVDYVKRDGADRVRLSDTVGILNPLQTIYLVRAVSPLSDVEVHFHNDFGMATANSITAVFAGAKYINASLLGLGERCGITPLEEVVFYLELIQGIDTGIKADILYQIIKNFIKLCNIDVNPNKPLLGKNAFTNKSSIHIDGLKKAKDTYLPFDPSLIGEEATVSLGLYSGKWSKLCDLLSSIT